MAKISEQFIWVDNDTEFKLRLEAGDVQEESIAFISKPKLIWTHNTYFNCYYTLKEIDDKNKELDSKIESEREALELSLKDSFYEIQDFTLNASPTEDLINASIGSYDKLKDAIDNGDIILVTRPGSAGKSTAVAYKDNSNNIIVTYPHFDNNDWTVLAVIKSPAATVSSEINKSEVHVIKPRYIIEVNKSLDIAVANDIKTAITDSELKEAIDNEIPSFIRFTGENNVTFTPISILLADGITYLTWVVNNYCWIFKQETDKETLTKLNFTDYVKKAGDTMTGDLTFNGTNLGIKTLTPSKPASVYALEIKEENQNGSAVLIGAGGNTFIGSGESAQSVYAVKKDTITPNGKETYITSDNVVHIITNTQNVGSSSPNLDGTKSWLFKTDGNILPPSEGLYLGNASTATKLATTRKIWGNDFDGSKDISYITVTSDNKDVLNTTGGTAFFDVKGGVLTDKDTTDHVIFQVDSLYKSYQLRCDTDHLVHRFNERQTEGWTDWHTIANKSDIPTKLPNPQSFTVQGVSYDGSLAKTVTIPEVSDTASGLMTPSEKKKLDLLTNGLVDSDKSAHTLTEELNTLTEKVNGADVNDQAVANLFVTQVTQTDGKIAVTRAQPTVTSIKDLQSNLDKYVKKSGDTMTGNLVFQGDALGIKVKTSSQTAEKPAITFYNISDSDTGIAIGVGGRSVIGSGESALFIYNLKANSNEGLELLYLSSDGTISIITNTQDLATGWENRIKEWKFGSDGNLTTPGNLTATKLIKSGGTSSLFLKADGSVDTNSYAKSSDLTTLQETVTELLGSTGSSDYTLPVASSTELGGVKLYSDTVASNSPESISTKSGRTYQILMNSDDLLVVNVPWTDTVTSGGSEGTTYTAGDGIIISGDEISIDINDSYSPSSDNTKVDLVVNYDGLAGYISNSAIKSVVGSSSGGGEIVTAGDGLQKSGSELSIKIDNTASSSDIKVDLVADSSGLSGSVLKSTVTSIVDTIVSEKIEGMGGSNYVLPNATTTKLGGVKLGSDDTLTVNASTPTKQANRTYAILNNSSGQLVVNVPWTDTTYSDATSSKSGLMTPSDKSKLDSLPSTVKDYTLPAATSSALGGIKIGYSASGNNYAVLLDSSSKAYVTVPSSSYTLPVATSSALGGIKLGYSQTGLKYAVAVDSSQKAYVEVPWKSGVTSTTVTEIQVVSSLPSSQSNGVLYLVFQ